MQDILFEYQLNPTTWAYLAALLAIGIFFKFHRFWSVRNLDLVGLLFFSPGLLLVFHGLAKELPDLVSFGYVWLFAVSLFFVVRLFLDPIMVRRPLLEPNLNASGLTFTGLAVLVFLTANVLASSPPERLEHELAEHDPPAIHSPGFPFFHYVASFVNSPKMPQPAKVQAPWEYPSRSAQIAISRVIVLTAQFLLILGVVLIGFRHFDNIQTGVAAASLYLLLPYTGQMFGAIDHAVPGALLVWTIAAYRRPAVAGMLLGLAGGLIFYPLFLLPLWCSFYWRRGLFRFLGGLAASLLVLVILLAFLSTSGEGFAAQLQQMFGGTLFSRADAAGFWRSYEPAYRIPILAVFVVLAASLGLWPAQKNLGTLLSCSATVMLAAQFWHLHEGGLYMAWYLPLLVLTIFRPNLEDRVASSAVIEGRTTWVGRLLGRWQKPA